MKKEWRPIRKPKRSLRLDINSWRWKNVPFYIRAGKCLPVTCTEIIVRLCKPPTMFEGYHLMPNYVRIRIGPENVFALGMMSISPADENVAQCLESITSRHPCPTEMDAYERLLTDAMAGDATHFAREDYVEEAWRIVDPVLKAPAPVTEY